MYLYIQLSLGIHGSRAGGGDWFQDSPRIPKPVDAQFPWLALHIRRFQPTVDGVLCLALRLVESRDLEAVDMEGQLYLYICISVVHQKNNI